jgi:hypothetical protein
MNTVLIFISKQKYKMHYGRSNSVWCCIILNHLSVWCSIILNHLPVWHTQSLFLLACKVRRLNVLLGTVSLSLLSHMTVQCATFPSPYPVRSTGAPTSIYYSSSLRQWSAYTFFYPKACQQTTWLVSNRSRRLG